MRMACGVGARPQLIRVAGTSSAMRPVHDEILIDTDPHREEQSDTSFFAEAGLPKPDDSPGVGLGSGAEQAGRMLLKLGPILEQERPDAVSSTATKSTRVIAVRKVGPQPGCARQTLIAACRIEGSRIVCGHAQRRDVAPPGGRAAAVRSADVAAL